MHPILENRQRLGLYLAAWVPIAAIFTAILKRGMASWPEAALVAGPMSLLYAFVCLSSWYVCLAVPMRQPSLSRLVTTMLAAAAISSAAWFALGEVWVLSVEPWLGVEGLSDRYLGQSLLVFANGAMLYILTAAGHYLLIAVDESRIAEKRALELQVLAREAELKALRAQIDPHFLFNSLNSISALTVADPPGARRMCLLLADFLRSSLVLGAKQQISVSEELRLVESFLSIEKVRYGKRLDVVMDVDESCGECLVPPLLIQPLVENAIRHGIAPLVEGGTIQIHVHRESESVEIRLENPVEAAPRSSSTAGAGVGLENVRSRLTRLFTNQAKVNIANSEGRFQVSLQFPCVRFGENS